MKKPILFVIFGLLACCCVCVLVFGGLTLAGAISLSTAPYSFSKEQLTGTYLKSKAELGGLKKVDLGSDFDALFANENLTLGFYNKAGVLSTEAQATTADGVVIMVGTGSKEYDENLQSSLNETQVSADTSNCNPYESRNGTAGNVKYYKAVCGTGAIYSYSDGDNWILFSTSQEGAIVLENAIRDYQK